MPQSATRGIKALVLACALCLLLGLIWIGLLAGGPGSSSALKHATPTPGPIVEVVPSTDALPELWSSDELQQLCSSLSCTVRLRPQPDDGRSHIDLPHGWGSQSLD